MAINPALLVSAAILQDYFSDNATDAAMSAGVITCYRDNSRTTLKNWYYQTGSPGAYTYTQLPNPLTLSAAGTITDAMGNDTIPFWYPYSELDNTTPQPYYVTVDNSNGQRQFTRQNFPFVAPNSGGNSGTNTLRNLIVNNVFWRNAGTVSLKNSSGVVLAPSQHDGFLGGMSDIQFFKNANGATDVATFTAFTNINRLPGDATPEFYLNMSCNNSGSSETSKYIQIPICLHVDNLSGYGTASATIWTQNVGGSANNSLTLNLYQYLGTGATSPAATTLVTIMPSSSWQKTVVNFSFPVATLPPGGAGDDGWFLQIGLPLGVSYNMNIAKPAIYLSETVPSDDFDTYEFVSATIDSPRTGDIRTSLNTWYPFGWVQMNDGTIGNSSSNATTRANIDTWPLFSLIWNTFAYLSNPNLVVQMYNSSGTPVSYGASAIADFNANNALSLTQALGKALLGGLNNRVAGDQNGQEYTITGNTLVMTSTSAFFTGAPVILTTTVTAPSGLSAGVIYYAINLSSTTISLATTYANALAGTVITISSSGTGLQAAFTTLTGTTTGEYSHTQLVTELASHSHTINLYSAPGSTSQVSYSGNVNESTTATTNTAGSSKAFNVTQPSVFYNMFMKL